MIALAITIFTASATVLSGLMDAPGAYAADEGFVISSSDAPTIFSSQVDMSMVQVLDSLGNISGASPEVFAFSSWGDASFVVRGVDLQRLQDTGPTIDLGPLEEEIESLSGGEALVGARLMKRLNIVPPCSIVLVGTYSSKLAFVEVLGSFSSGSPLDDELLVSLGTARHLSGMPEDLASIIRVKPDDPAWFDSLLSPRVARFVISDLGASRAVVEVNDTFQVMFDVRNWGGTAGTAEIAFKIDAADPSDSWQENITVSLAAHETRTVTRNVKVAHYGPVVVNASLGGGFPVELTKQVMVVAPYLTILVPREVLQGAEFDATVVTGTGAPVMGAAVVFDGISYVSDPDGKVRLSTDSTGNVPITASYEGYESALAIVEVLDLASLPGEFSPRIVDLSAVPDEAVEGDTIIVSVSVTNRASVGGTFQVPVTVDGSMLCTLSFVLGPVDQSTLSVAIEDLAPGSHFVSAGPYSVNVYIAPWYAEDPNLVQLVVRYGSSTSLSSSDSVPIYQAAKISEGNVAVALFSVGVVSALLASIAIVSVFSKEVHESRHKLGVLRTVGASRSSLRWIIFQQSIVVGLAGSAIGIVLGMIVVDVISASGVFAIFGHEFSIELASAPLVLILLGSVAISVLSALASAEVAARETTISSIRRLPGTPGPRIDPDELLRED